MQLVISSSLDNDQWWREQLWLLQQWSRYGTLLNNKCSKKQMTKIVAPKLVPRVFAWGARAHLEYFPPCFLQCSEENCRGYSCPVVPMRGTSHLVYAICQQDMCVYIYVCIYIICDYIWKFACNTKYFGAAVCSWFYENKSKQSNRISCIWQTSYMFQATHIVTHHMCHYRKQDFGWRCDNSVILQMQLELVQPHQKKQ